MDDILPGPPSSWLGSSACSSSDFEFKAPDAAVLDLTKKHVGGGGGGANVLISSG